METKDFLGILYVYIFYFCLSKIFKLQNYCAICTMSGMHFFLPTSANAFWDTTYGYPLKAFVCEIIIHNTIIKEE